VLKPLLGLSVYSGMPDSVVTITVSKRTLLLLAVLAVVAFVVSLACLDWIPKYQYQNKVAEAKLNLHAVQLALERFAVEQPDSTYPADIRELISTGFLTEFPPNPFTGQPMQPISIVDGNYDGHGLLNIPGAQHGDFVYYPRRNTEGELKPSAYTLFLY
jgi:hypothetical protein